MQDFSNILSFVPGGTLLWALFFFALLATIITSLILLYHWIRFAMSPGVATVALLIHSAVSIVLIILMLTALFAL